jgi:5-methylcytosine-specific restriction endonuclease McrA
MSAPLLRRPIFGGAFGQGEFELATQPTIVNGLHAVRFMVVQARVGRVLAVAETKAAALADARHVLRATASANDEEPQWKQPRLWPVDEDLSVINGHAHAPPRAVSRRRREIFVRSGGKCFYCGTSLRIDGEWACEHQQPKSLGGADDPLNLVASCYPCNQRKGTQTAFEFIASSVVMRKAPG